MAQSIRFLRCCPACKRSLQISIELLGKDVECRFCRAQFRACVGDKPTCKAVDEIDERVAQLIQAADQQLVHYQSAASLGE